MKMQFQTEDGSTYEVTLVPNDRTHLICVERISGPPGQAKIGQKFLGTELKITPHAGAWLTGNAGELKLSTPSIVADTINEEGNQAIGLQVSHA